MFVWVCGCVSAFVVASRSVCLVIKTIFVALNLLPPHDFFCVHTKENDKSKTNKMKRNEKKNKKTSHTLTHTLVFIHLTCFFRVYLPKWQIKYTINK